MALPPTPQSLYFSIHVGEPQDFLSLFLFVSHDLYLSSNNSATYFHANTLDLTIIKNYSTSAVLFEIPNPLPPTTADNTYPLTSSQLSKISNLLFTATLNICQPAF